MTLMWLIAIKYFNRLTALIFSHISRKDRWASVTGYLFPAFSWLVTYWSSPASSMGYFLNTAPHRLARPRDRVTWHHHTAANTESQSAERIDNRGTYSAARRRWLCRRVSSFPSPDWPEPRWCNLIGRLRKTMQKTKQCVPSYMYWKSPLNIICLHNTYVLCNHYIPGFPGAFYSLGGPLSNTGLQP